MNLQLNGKAVETSAQNLADLVEEQGLGTAKIATAVNGAFVPAGLRPATALNAGDQVEILAPMQGG